MRWDERVMNQAFRQSAQANPRLFSENYWRCFFFGWRVVSYTDNENNAGSHIDKRSEVNGDTDEQMRYLRDGAISVIFLQYAVILSFRSPSIFFLQLWKHLFVLVFNGCSLFYFCSYTETFAHLILLAFLMSTYLYPFLMVNSTKVLVLSNLLTLFSYKFTSIYFYINRKQLNIG